MNLDRVVAIMAIDEKVVNALQVLNGIMLMVVMAVYIYIYIYRRPPRYALRPALGP